MVEYTVLPGKAELRQRFCALRECQLPGDVAAISLALCERLARWPLLADARAVLAYLAFRNEIDLRPLFMLLPQIRWAVPRVARRRLVIHAYDPQHLVRHRFGMLEPDAALPEIAPEALDVVLVPGVAFDRQGARLGFGGGYYDRFLPTTPAVRVGVTSDTCIADELPCSDLDQRMDWLATPTEIIHCLREAMAG